MEPREPVTASKAAHGVIVGAGGNIGSSLTPLLARTGLFDRLTLIDPDYYTFGNIKGQNVSRGDVGRPKCEVMADAVRAVAPKIKVTALKARVEDVPLGTLVADVLCCGLDSRLARMFVNERAFWLGIPWIDAGVSGPELLARVDAYRPGPDAACYECAFTAGHYENLETRYPCSAVDVRSTPTGSPAYLGAAAASLAAAECVRILLEADAPARQTVFGLQRADCLSTWLRPNPACRFNHTTLSIELLDIGVDMLTILDIQRLCPGCRHITAPGYRFTKQDVCSVCRTACSGPRLLRGTPDPCRECGGALYSGALDVTDELMLDALPPARTLSELGFQPLDIFGCGGLDVDRFFLLPAAERQSTAGGY